MKTTTLACFIGAALSTGGLYFINQSTAGTTPQPSLPNGGNTGNNHGDHAGSAGANPPSAPQPHQSRAMAPAQASPPTEARPQAPAQSNAGPHPASGQGTPAPASSAANSPASLAGVATFDAARFLQNADLADPKVRAQAVAEMSRNEERRMDGVLEKAGRLGIPVRIDGPGGKVSILHAFRGDEPLYRTTKNKNAAISAGANLAQAAPYALDGGGVKVGVWDGGSVRNTHRELSGRVANRNAGARADDHATHVAGTIAAAGADAGAKGMAPKANIDSYDWDNDYAEMTAAGSASAGDLAGVTISNHSYGYDASTQDMGRYETEARTVDGLAWAMPFYLPFWAAGNEQDSLTALGGFQSITFSSLAKNILTIGAVNDAVSAGVRFPAGGSMTSFSSWGPCDDGRIKPDLVANGAGVLSSTAASDSSYDTYSGTSMAAPNAAGSAALLQQLYAKNFNQRLRASSLKGLLIHTADDLGNPGPDYKFGWGLVNTKAAADLIIAQKSNPASPKLLENAITPSARSVSTGFTWSGTGPIRATLCWTDPAGTAQAAADSRTPNLVHDLDLRITGPDGSTAYLPFTMPFVGTWTTAAMSAAAATGKNRTDNVEQVLIANPNRPGTYTVTVSIDGQLTTSAQPYSLVVTGMSGLANPGTSPTPTPTPSPTPAPSPSPSPVPSPTPRPTPANPAPSVTLSAPLNGTAIALGSSVAVSATATDLASSGAAGVVSKVEFFNGSASIGVDTTAPYSVSWRPSAAGNYTLLARATDSQGAVGTSASASLRVVAPNPPPAISGFSPSSGPVGTSVVVTGSNFSGVTGIQFNGANATVWSVVSPTQISVVVPAGATTGPVRVSTASASAVSAAPFTVTTPPAGKVAISQIYPGGGRWWSDYSNDFVELYNPGTTPVSLSGWSLQLSGGAAAGWTVVPLGGTIPAKGFYLIALAGGGYEYDLPAADASSGFDLPVKQGKAALMRNAKPIAAASPAGLAALSDFVGYGATDAWEGSSPAISPERWYAIFRLDGSDTNDNYADFDWDYAAPRNSKSPATLMIKRRK